jgi:hypothetical protein
MAAVHEEEEGKKAEAEEEAVEACCNEFMVKWQQ